MGHGSRAVRANSIDVHAGSVSELARVRDVPQSVVSRGFARLARAHVLAKKQAMWTTASSGTTWRARRANKRRPGYPSDEG